MLFVSSRAWRFQGRVFNLQDIGAVLENSANSRLRAGPKE
jgi:hypothetical protein